jgi:triosephosphate isomerase (TIM)
LGVTNRRILICGNWKMNGRQADGLALARQIAEGGAQAGADLVICPPATLIAPVVAAVRETGVSVGGQDCHAKASGAFTGDIAAPMLADLGCRYVIVGHSERRAYHHESDSDVQAKAQAALAAGLIAIVCVGETLAERDGGRMPAIIRSQLAGSVGASATDESLVVAYEPVWAIGTGRTATAAQVAEVHALIRSELAARLTDGANVRILYGGSVKPENAGELLGLADVDGALVGGASLNAKSFLAIAAAAPRR